MTGMTDTIPTMLYDGDCGFCTQYIKKWQAVTRGSISYEPYQKALAGFPKLSETACKEAVQLILPDGTVFSGAHAVFKALDLSGRFRIFHFLYDRLPFFGRASELMYQLIAHHRVLISKLLYGKVQKCG